MKRFADYLIESVKTYKFHIRIAGVLPEGCNENMNSALKKYDIKSLSSGKTGPITERPLDFPNLSNVEVTHYEAELNYPVTSQILQNYIAECCKIPESHIVVRGEGEPLEMYQEKADDAPYESMLNTEEMGGESAQDSVAGNRVMDLLKELEQVRKERDHEPTAGTPVGESTDIDNTENTKSVVGS
jgi:hypothetical protein